MQQSKVSSSIALPAAKLSLDLKLAMADSIILATAQVWTQDEDFAGLSGGESGILRKIASC